MMRMIPVVCAINKEKSEVLGWRKGAADIHEIVVRVATGNEGATEEAAKALAAFFEVPAEEVVCVEGDTSRHKLFVLPIDEETLVRLLP